MAPPQSGEVVSSSRSAAALRWQLLSRSLPSLSEPISHELAEVSRRPAGRFDLVPCRIVCSLEQDLTGGPNAPGDQILEYNIPVFRETKLVLRQKQGFLVSLNDLAVCERNAVDNTGAICVWPAEEILTYFCVCHPEIFRNKTVIELGSGYGLGGLAIAACTEAAEVLLTDGNPQVVKYIEENIKGNLGSFGDTVVEGLNLSWSRDQVPLFGRTFDLVVAADCTFFQEFHEDLAHTIKCLIGGSKTSQAIIFSPRRGNSLDKFVYKARSIKLDVKVHDRYDEHVWNLRQQFIAGDKAKWSNYDDDHCYPLLVSMRHELEA